MQREDGTCGRPESNYGKSHVLKYLVCAARFRLAGAR